MKKTFFGFVSFSAICLANDPCNDIIANAPLYPITCNGDLSLSISGLYWNYHETGFAYAVQNFIHVPVINPTTVEIEELNNLIDDDIEVPKGSWEFGFKLGLGYNTACDGWDLGLLWTRYHPSTHGCIETGVEDNATLISLISAFAPIQGEVNFAREIERHTKIELDLIDFELGRAYWISKRTHFRPFVGFRYAKLDRKFQLDHKGGSWSPRMNPPQPAFRNKVSLCNDYDGFGLRSGLDAAFHLSCGFRVYGGASASIIYGRFNVSHDEENHLINNPFTKEKILDSRAHFRASRAILDVEAGIAWSAQVCECRYAVQTRLAWEHHLFLHQNQFYRVVRIGDIPQAVEINDSGENIYEQVRGDFATQGWTLSLQLFF